MSKILSDIYNNYKNDIYRFFLKMTSDKDISDDLTQDTFLKAFKYFESFKSNANMKTWLLKIASNILKDYYGQKSKITVDSLYDYNEIPEQEDQFGNLEDRIYIQNIINILDDNQKMIFVLRFINDLEYNTIAEIIGDSPSNIRIKIFRIKKQLREIKEEE